MSIAGEILSSINSDYTSDIKYLSEQVSVDTADFESMDIARQYWLDTKSCVKGYGKRRKINTHNLYEIFGNYSLDSPDVVKQNAIAEIESHPSWYDCAGRTMLVMKGTTFKKWLAHIKKPRSRGDELMLFVLCVLYRRHCIVYTKWQPWYTVKPEAGRAANTIEEMCQTKLLYLGNDLYGELHRLPLSRVPETPCSLRDIQSGRLVDRDTTDYNIHLTVIGVSKQTGTSNEPVATDRSEDTNTGTTTDVDTKPGTKAFDVFSDEYARFLAIPKQEPGETPVSLEIKTEPDETGTLIITDVRTIGHIEGESSITQVDPKCVLHGSSTIIEAFPSDPGHPLSAETSTGTIMGHSSLREATHTTSTPITVTDTLLEATGTPDTTVTRHFTRGNNCVITNCTYN